MPTNNDNIDEDTNKKWEIETEVGEIFIENFDQEENQVVNNDSREAVDVEAFKGTLEKETKKLLMRKIAILYIQKKEICVKE